MSSVFQKADDVSGFIEALAGCDGDRNWTAEYGRRATPRVLPAPTGLAENGKRWRSFGLGREVPLWIDPVKLVFIVSVVSPSISLLQLYLKVLPISMYLHSYN